MATNNDPRVVYLTSEVSPLLKVGGLGDVASSLPPTLRNLGIDVTILMPWSDDIILPPGNRDQTTFISTILPKKNTPVIILKRPSLDPHLILDLRREGVLPFDLLHGNDWFSSDAIVACQQEQIPTILTIHNFSYQPERLLPAIQAATKITTVSPSYADEIRAQTRSDLVGILNGIDPEVWNPATDPLIPHQYGRQNWTVGKQKNKDTLIRSLGLSEPTRPLLAFIGRLDSRQKGVDKIIGILQTLLAESNVVILGTGSDELERVLQEASEQNPDHLRVNLCFDEKLAHQIYAGADMMLLPSSFEPCGLVQMISMRYGTIPIAHAVGGLKDSIQHLGSGVLYQEENGLPEAITQALDLKKSDTWSAMVTTAMQQDFSWEKSAKRYADLYKEVLTST